MWDSLTQIIVNRIYYVSAANTMLEKKRSLYEQLLDSSTEQRLYFIKLSQSGSSMKKKTDFQTLSLPPSPAHIWYIVIFSCFRQ